MPSRPAAALRALLVSAVLSGAAAAPSPCRADVAAQPPEHARPAVPVNPSRGAQRDDRANGGRKPREPEPELLDHLDVIEHLELLQNLELFDTGAVAPRK